MIKMKNKKQYLRFLDNLTEFLGSSDGMTIDEIKDELREYGIDPDETTKKLEILIKKYSLKAKERENSED
jgi:hypothetical protein